ncbi:UvrD-helicase domain-containing protein [Blattabacterium cuenoti]|uniref:UvrD-helicase domain-containing protein n=1 Tax=Blattabacterium cuenoti TaxID=1653831 RepID=UPI00163C2AF2|nr:UvrD-helicase domain-containing protein [Blattabacterium cuenoti]
MLELGTFNLYNASAGTGKTSVLISKYLYILLKSRNPDEFKKILVLTFTKKSSEEIKKRILKCIENLSNQKKIDKEFHILLDNLIQDSHLTKKDCYNRSKNILCAILNDFSSFSQNVSTIDKFTYRIVRSFLYKKELSLEMNTNQFVSEVVKNITYSLMNSKKWTKFLIQYSLDRFQSGKSWNIEKELEKIAFLMINENHFFSIKKMENYSVKNFLKLKNTLKIRTTYFEKICKMQGEKFFHFLEKNCIQKSSFTCLYFYNFFQKLRMGRIILNPFTKRLCNNIQKGKIFSLKILKKNTINSLDQKCKKIFYLYNKTKNLYNKKISFYLLDKILLNNINFLLIFHEMNQEFSSLKEKKRIILNADLNKILHDKLIKSLPKIYETIGTKYQHYLIDEFQDISYLQWKNIKILVENALSENGTAIIVGDPKQSIYRWRGGDSQQMIDIINSKKTTYKKKIKTINTNFRSFQEIVNFNNSFYTYISKFFRHTIYQNIYQNSTQKTFKNKKGYVELNFYNDHVLSNKYRNYKEYIYNNIKKKINKCLQQKYSLSDISILVRTNEECHFLSEHLIKDGVRVNTYGSLLIKNYVEIKIITNVLDIISHPFSYDKRFVLILLLLENHFFQNQKNIHDFIVKIIHLPLDSFLEKIILKKYLNKKKIYNKSIYQISKIIIESFHLLNKKNYAIIYAYLDFIYRSTKKTGNSILDFLENWELRKNQESIFISGNTNNLIHVMTIHKSKGLQYPIVMIPFASWKIIPSRKKEGEWININPFFYHGINSIYIELEPFFMKINNQKIRNLYKNHLSKMLFDNINLLYVATTRPIEQLILFSKIANEKYISYYIKDFLHEKKIWNDQQFCYFFGKKTIKND